VALPNGSYKLKKERKGKKLSKKGRQMGTVLLYGRRRSECIKFKSNAKVYKKQF